LWTTLKLLSTGVRFVYWVCLLLMSYCCKQCLLELGLFGILCVYYLSSDIVFLNNFSKRGLSCAREVIPFVRKKNWHVVCLIWEREKHEKSMNKFRSKVGSNWFINFCVFLSSLVWERQIRYEKHENRWINFDKNWSKFIYQFQYFFFSFFYFFVSN
jgi:hypothetical protein